MSTWQWHPNRVLIVDDDVELAHSFRDILAGKGGYEVSIANTLPKAMELVDLFQPGFLLLDMQLDPQGTTTSLPLLKKLRDPVQQPVHVIVVTGQNQKYPQSEMFNAGGDNYFSKPVDVDVLLAYMRRVTEQHTLTGTHVSRRIHIPVGDLDLDTMTIYHSDKNKGLETIPRRVAQLIEILIKAYPQPISRQDLVRLLWPNTSEVSEGILRQVVFRARELLGSSEVIDNSLHDDSWYRWGIPISPDEDPSTTAKSGK
jgi:two-component system, OmpR family, response regulator YxdJ